LLWGLINLVALRASKEKRAEKRDYIHPHLNPLPSRERRILNTPSLRDTPLQEGKEGGFSNFFPSPLAGEGQDEG